MLLHQTNEKITFTCAIICLWNILSFVFIGCVSWEEILVVFMDPCPSPPLTCLHGPMPFTSHLPSVCSQCPNTTPCTTWHPNLTQVSNHHGPKEQGDVFYGPRTHKTLSQNLQVHVCILLRGKLDQTQKSKIPKRLRSTNLTFGSGFWKYPQLCGDYQSFDGLKPLYMWCDQKRTASIHTQDMEPAEHLAPCEGGSE